MKISDFKLNIDNIDNSTVGTVNAGFFKLLITITEPVLKTVLNLILGRGIDLSGILKKLGLTFIEFDATLLVPMDGYFLFFITPIFKLDSLSGLAEAFLQNTYEAYSSNEYIQEIVNATWKGSKDKVSEELKK